MKEWSQIKHTNWRRDNGLTATCLLEQDNEGYRISITPSPDSSPCLFRATRQHYGEDEVDVGRVNPLATPVAADADARLQRIVRRVVRRSFPRLRRVLFSISWDAGEDEFLYYAVRGEQHVIGVHECLREAPEPVLRGGLAHELCHIDADLKLGPYQRHLAWARYQNSRFYRMREERATESRLIELGYGRELLAFFRFARRRGFSFSSEHGLSLPEVVRAIRLEARSIGR